MSSNSKRPLGGGSPRFRKSNQADGSYPVPANPNGIPRRRNEPPSDLSDYKEPTLQESLDVGTHDAIGFLRWQMRNGNSLKAKERAANKLAGLGAPRPVQRLETDNKTQLTGTIEIELVRSTDGREIPNT